MAQLYGNLYEAGKPSDWKPLACTKQADGTYILKVDTELSIDSVSLNIDNLKIASTDQTVGNAKYIKVDATGRVYIIQDTYADLKNQSEIVNSSDVVINPATEDKQDNVITKLTSIDGKDFSTSAKQDVIIGHIDEIEGKLDSLIAAAGVVGTPKHYNGTANIASATVTFAGTTKHVQVENMDGTKDIYVSFDSGANLRTIQPGNVLDVDCAVASLDIKASADGCSYEILSVE